MKCSVFCSFVMGFGLLACSPKFSTTTPGNGALKKADVQSLLGSWLYTHKTQTYSVRIRMDIEMEKIRYDETCLAANTEVGIRTISRALVGIGKITLVDGITGEIQNGDLRCGLNFAAAEYSAAIDGNTLTLKTATGPIKFEKIR